MRNEIMTADAQRTIKLSLNRQLRANMCATYKYNDRVQIYSQGAWSGTYRVMAYTGGSTLILDRAGKLIKHPASLVRPLSEVTNTAPLPLEADPDRDQDLPSNPAMPGHRYKRPRILGQHLANVITSDARKRKLDNDSFMDLDIAYNERQELYYYPERRGDYKSIFFTKPLGMREKPPALETDDPILPTSTDAKDEFEQPVMTQEEEDLLTGHDLSRLPPRVFRKLPGAMVA